MPVSGSTSATSSPDDQAPVNLLLIAIDGDVETDHVAMLADGDGHAAG